MLVVIEGETPIGWCQWYRWDRYNGFDLLAVRPVASGPDDNPMAIYRLAPPSTETIDPHASRVLLVDAATGRLPGPVVVVLEGVARAGVPEGEVPGATAVPGATDVPETTTARAGQADGAAPEDPARCDADGSQVAPSPRAGNRRDVRVVHAAGSGDDRLVDLAVAAAPASATVVTADRELRERIAAVGVAAVGPGWLYDRLGRAGG